MENHLDNFKKDGYVLIKNFLSKEMADLFYYYIKMSAGKRNFLDEINFFFRDLVFFPFFLKILFILDFLLVIFFRLLALFFDLDFFDFIDLIFLGFFFFLFILLFYLITVFMNIYSLLFYEQNESS